MPTQSFNSDTVTQAWHVVDLDGKVLGRAASRIASVLRGKHKPQYTPHADVGDFIVVVNADRLVLTGNKLKQKLYHHHTGFMGGIKSISAERLLEKDSTRMVEAAVKGMLPRGPLGRRMLKKLKIYAGSDHPHAAQKPAPLAV